MSREPPAPRPSATVILVRPEGEEPSVYLLRRNPRSGFMGGFYVFPGGTVENQDRHPQWSRHFDTPLRQLAARLGGDLNPYEIAAYLTAAVRETFEEAGVLLADKPGRANPGCDCDAIRRGHSNEPRSPDWFLEAVSDGGWRLAASRCYRWARWMTPEQMHRRFDTRFFLTAMPADRRCSPDGHETVHGVWMTPHRAVAANHQGRIPLSPPTLMTLQAMRQYPSYNALLKDARRRAWGPVQMPRLVRLDGDRRVILAPWDPAYPHRRVDIDPRRAALLPPGVSFSRMLLKDGVWRPISVED